MFSLKKQSTSAENPPAKAAAEEEEEMDEEEYKLLGSNKLATQNWCFTYECNPLVPSPFNTNFQLWLQGWRHKSWENQLNKRVPRLPRDAFQLPSIGGWMERSKGGSFMGSCLKLAKT